MPAPASTLLSVRLTPRAARERLAPGPDGAFVAHVTAPPVEGAANEALVALLAKCLALPRSAVTLVAGDRARVKRLRLSGDGLAARLSDLVGAG